MYIQRTITAYIFNFDLLLNNTSNTLQEPSYYGLSLPSPARTRSEDRVRLSDIYIRIHE